MPTNYGDLALLNDPVAMELLVSAIPARLAYTWRDGTPRVIAIWFHWNGKEIVMGTPITAPKNKIVANNSKVALTIDGNTWPYKALQIRGTATVQRAEGIVPEYAAAAERYFGKEGAEAWLAQVRQMNVPMVRIAIRPEWVSILDFQTHFPSAIEKAMAGA